MRVAAGLAIICLAATGLFANAASAQPSDDVQWEVIVAAPGQLIFFNARQDRMESSVESATVFTYHVLKTPMKGPNGQLCTMYLQRTKCDWLEPQMSRVYVAGYDDAWNAVFVNDVATPMVPFALGAATESISVMACDHFNPTDNTDIFTSRQAATAFAKARLAGN